MVGIYCYKKSFTGLGPEDRCSSWWLKNRCPLANLAHHAYAAELGSLRFIRGMICVLELVILLNILFIINKNCEDTIFDFIVCIDPYNVNSISIGDLPCYSIFPETTVKVSSCECSYTTTQSTIAAYFPCDK